MISSSSILSAFEIGQQVSETPRTAIYRGRHLASDSAAAIKLIKVTGLRGAEDRRLSFEKRGQALLEIKHPGMPTTLDLGRTDEGVFLGFEWVEGQRLQDLQELDAKSRILHLQRAIEGLRALADRGLALVNLCPSNLFVRTDGSTMLTGLGTGFANPEGRHESRGKRPTNRYLAPEIKTSRALEKPDLWRADVFSLAMTAAELFGAEVRGAGGPVPYVKLPGELERQVPSSADLGMLLERGLHQKPDRRPELALVLETLQLCLYDFESVEAADSSRSETASSGNETMALPAAGAEEMGFEIEIEDDPIEIDGGGQQPRTTAAQDSAEPKQPAAEKTDPTIGSASDSMDDSIVGSLRKMWSEGLADIDLKSSAEAIRGSADVEVDSVVSDEGTVVSADQSAELEPRDQPLAPVETPDEILEIDELPPIEPLTGVRPAVRQPEGGVARVADEVASLLGGEATVEEPLESTPEPADSHDELPTTGEIDLTAAAQVLDSPPEQGAEVEVGSAASELVEVDGTSELGLAEPRAAEPWEAEPWENETAGSEPPVAHHDDEPEAWDSIESQTRDPEPLHPEPFDPDSPVQDSPTQEPEHGAVALPDLREPALSDVEPVLVPQADSTDHEPRSDPYRIPFFLAAAAAGLFLIAFLWSLLRTPPAFDPDISRPVDLAQTDSADAMPSDSTPSDSAPSGFSGSSSTEGVDPPPLSANAPAEPDTSEPAIETIEPLALPESVVADLPRQPETAIPTNVVTTPSSNSVADAGEATSRGSSPVDTPPATTAAGDREPASSTTPTSRSTASPATVPRATVRDLSPDSVAPLRADLEVALRTGDLSLLRSTLGRATGSDLRRLERDDKGRSALEFARLVSTAVDEIEAAIGGGDELEALARADRLARQFPAIENSLALRDRAARSIEAEVERLVAAGRVIRAEELLRQLERSWPDRSDLGSKLRLVENLKREAQAEVALAEILALERDRLPHAALERLAQLESQLDPTTVAELRTRFDTQLTQMDRSAPRIEIDANSDLEARSDRALVLRLRVDDDYLVESLSTHVRGQGGSFREITAERLGSRVFRLVVPAEVHRNQRFHLWAEAIDYRGHVGRLGSPNDPVKVKWRP